MFAHVRGTARLWEDNPGVPAKLPLSEDRFAIDHGMEKVDIVRFSRGSKPVKLSDVVYCVGNGTAFHLTRAAGEKDYSVKGIGKTKMDGHLYVSVFGRFVNAHHGVQGRSMSSLLKSSDFKITDAEALHQAGKSMMRIDCLVGPIVASLVLDPDAGWVVRSGRFHPSDAPADLSSVEVEYGLIRNGIPLPRQVKYDWPSGIVEHCEFTGWDLRHDSHF